jgi:GABA permease
VSIVSIVALLIGMVILESTRESLLLSLALAAVVVGIGVFRYRRNGAKAAVPAAGAAEAPAGDAAPVDAEPGAEDATVGARPVS